LQQAMDRRRHVLLAAALAALALTAVLATGCGGDERLAWSDTPRTAGAAGVPTERLLSGTLVNRSAAPVRVRTDDVRVIGADGSAYRTVAAFRDGYDAAVGRHAYATMLFAGAAAPAGEVVLRPGHRMPIKLAFTVPGADARAVAVQVAGTRLRLK